MTILSDKDLKTLLSSNEPIIYTMPSDSPMNMDVQMGPSSIDLRLGKHFIIFKKSHMSMIDTKNMTANDSMEDIITDEENGIIIHPGEFILGTTLVRVRVPDNMVARLEGRSSYARLGIAVHSTAGFIDPGFEGQVTMEIQNLGVLPIRLYPNERVCQIVFETMTSSAEVPYGKKKDSKYMNQEGTSSSKLEREIRPSS